jgi:hypothetical protein
MNARVEMPDHGEIQTSHLLNFGHVFSGHFHMRQHRDNITYIGNAFPHNYSDAGDDDRGMMVLEWGKEPQFYTWPNQPRFRVYRLSEVLNDTDRLLMRGSNIRVNIDVDISYEESAFIREQLIPQYGLREMSLIPLKADLETDVTDYNNLKFESVDTIIQNQIEQLDGNTYDRRLLLEIYKNL